MKTSSPTYVWANELVSQIIEGACDSFLIVMGGSAAGQMSTGAVVPVSLKQLGISVAVGGGLYAAAYLKKHPLPTVTLPDPLPQINPPAIQPASPPTS